MRKIYFLSFWFIFFIKLASAQQTTVKLFSENFQQATITQFVNELESKSSYHFYYDPILFDSLKVTLEVTDKPLSSLLDLAFKNTDYYYAISQNLVFLTRGRQIKIPLATGFYAPASGTVPVSQAVVIADYTDKEAKKVPEATTENKLYEIGLKTNSIKP